MKKISLSDVEPYEAPGHFDMEARRIQGTAESGITTFWMGKSVFQPGGGADWAYEDNAHEKVYYVLCGEMTVTSKDEAFNLKPGDSLFIGPNEGRSMLNEGPDPCELLVVITYKPVG